MKKTLVYGTATAILVASLGSTLTLARCDRPGEIETLYGPPPNYQEDDDPIEDLYGPVPFDDTDEDGPVETLYGPPPGYPESSVDD